MTPWSGRSWTVLQVLLCLSLAWGASQLVQALFILATEGFDWPEGMVPDGRLWLWLGTQWVMFLASMVGEVVLLREQRWGFWLLAVSLTIKVISQLLMFGPSVFPVALPVAFLGTYLLTIWLLLRAASRPSPATPHSGLQHDDD